MDPHVLSARPEPSEEECVAVAAKDASRPPAAETSEVDSSMDDPDLGYDVCDTIGAMMPQARLSALCVRSHVQRRLC